MTHPRADIERISIVLDELTFPAAKWQVVVQADWYGADAATLAQLWALPAAIYRDLSAVLGALGLRPSYDHRSAATAATPLRR